MRSRAMALVALVAGCAHAQFRDWVYRDGATSFRVGPLPPTWRRLDGDAKVQFFAPRLDAVIMANTECKDVVDVPLEVLGNDLLAGFTDRRVRSEGVEPFDGREALHRVVDARLDGVPRTVESYVMKKDGCVWDLVYAAPPPGFAEGRTDFARFVAGFATLGS